MQNARNPLENPGEAQAQALAHQRFNEAAALYQNSYGAAYLSRCKLRNRVKAAAFKWIGMTSSVPPLSGSGNPVSFHQIDDLRMGLLRKNPPTNLEWLLTRVGQSGEKYTLSDPKSFVSTWAGYRISEIDQTLAKRGSWGLRGPHCRSVRIKTNEALATFRIAAIAATTKDGELIEFARLLIAP